MADAIRILLVEDDPLVRQVLAQTLTFLGHEVQEASGGREALARLEAMSVDLVLTDLRMPEMSGWEVAKAVKAGWPHVAIGVLTGTAEALLEKRGEPVDFVLSKPITMDALGEAIGRIRPRAPTRPSSNGSR